MSSSIPTNSPPVVTFEEVQAIAKDPKAIGIIIDVRQPEEISSTGLIPSSHNIPRRPSECLCSTNRSESSWRAFNRFQPVGGTVQTDV